MMSNRPTPPAPQSTQHSPKTDDSRAQAASPESLRDHPVLVLFHEIRNPLTAIQAAAEVLNSESGLSPEAQKTIQIISRQTRNITRIANYVVQCFEHEHEGQAAEWVPVDLVELAGDVVETVHPQVQNRQQHLKIRQPSKPVCVLGDPVQLQQAQVNLLVNASKFTATDGTIEYLIESEIPEAIVTVRDNGCGIEADRLNQIFEPFQGGGSGRIGDELLCQGIGLALVKQIVDAHRGSILVTSGGRQRGSEFTIRLPLCK